MPARFASAIRAGKSSLRIHWENAARIRCRGARSASAASAFATLPEVETIHSSAVSKQETLEMLKGARLGPTNPCGPHLNNDYDVEP